MRPLIPFSSPWLLTGVLITANTLLSYFPIPPILKILLISLGLVLAMALAWFRTSFQRDILKNLTQMEFLGPLPTGIFVLLGLGAIFLRFHQLTTLSRWPGADEAVDAHYALVLAEKGYWQWTYLFTGMPPLYVWLLGLCFKLFGVSLQTLWGLPAVLSTLGLGLAYLGARKFFARSFSLILTALIAFSFWPLYAARFSVQGSLMVFWMSVLFFVLGLYWRSPKNGFWLGLCVGIGFYTYTSWMMVALWVTLAVSSKTLAQSKPRWVQFFSFLGPEVLLALPLAWTMMTRGGGNFAYVFQNPLGPGLPGLNDLTSFFWGSRLPSNLFAYRPFWGGFLNPILGALCFVGAFTALRSGFSPWLLGSLLLGLTLPGVLSGGLDSFRTVQVLPLLLIGTALGLSSLLVRLPQGRRWTVAGLLLLASMVLDTRHLFGVYGSLWTQPRDNWFAIKSVERLRAYDLLREIAEKEGPGLVLSELVPDTYDQSLDVMDFPFNTTENLHLPAARWASLLVNIHYQPYLAKEFPEGRHFWLASDTGFSDGGLMLYVIPLPCGKPETLQRWIEVDRALQDLADEVFDNRDWKPRTPVIQSLVRLYPLLGGDRFLKACFGEKIAENEYWDHHWAAQATALQEAIEKGLPTAHLYNALGALDLRHHRYPEARRAFEKALQCSPNHTSAAQGLEALDQLEKTGQFPKD